VARKTNRKNRKPVPVPVASMGDIAFLLIIFFLVCSEVSKDKANLQAVMPLSEYVEKNESSAAARVAVDETGQIFFEGEPVADAKAVEWGVRAKLANTVADEQRHVQFKCDANLPKETFEPVLKAIAAAGGIIDAVGEKEQ
jgi:biopolymer transport protein ExbD